MLFFQTQPLFTRPERTCLVSYCWKRCWKRGSWNSGGQSHEATPAVRLPALRGCFESSRGISIFPFLVSVPQRGEYRWWTEQIRRNYRGNVARHCLTQFFFYHSRRVTGVCSLWNNSSSIDKNFGTNLELLEKRSWTSSIVLDVMIRGCRNSLARNKTFPFPSTNFRSQGEAKDTRFESFRESDACTLRIFE